MAVCWVNLRRQQIYTVIQAVHALLYIIAHCHLFSVVTWKDIIKYYRYYRIGVLTSVRYCILVVCVCVCVCVCVWAWERETGSHHSGVYSPSEKLKLAIIERAVIFPTQLVVFGQSQCNVPVGQSEQTVLVGRRDFVEAGHRGPTIMYSIWKIMCFFNIKACKNILLHKIISFKKAYDPFKVRVNRKFATVFTGPTCS